MSPSAAGSRVHPRLLHATSGLGLAHEVDGHDELGVFARTFAYQHQALLGYPTSLLFLCGLHPLGSVCVKIRHEKYPLNRLKP